MNDPLQNEIRLSGSFGSSVPPEVVAGTLRAVMPAIRSSTYMAIEGRGRLSGRRPKWASDVTDVRFCGANPDRNEMVLTFYAPNFGEAAPHLYSQRDFWRAPPPMEATAFEMLVNSLQDVALQNLDSEKYDQSVLGDIARFNKVLAEGDLRIQISGVKQGAEISKKTIDQVRSLSRSMPVPHQVRIVGMLDMIRASTQGFALKLDDGSEISGIYANENIADLQPLFRQRVVVNGALIYRPSGRPLRIDATHIRLSASPESAFWSQLPTPVQVIDNVRQLHQPQSRKSGVSAVIGRWPSDESDEKIAAELLRIS